MRTFIKALMFILFFSTLSILLSPKTFALDSYSRTYGIDRYETAIKISQKGWATSDNVVLASGENYPDALSAAPLANCLNAPILLSTPQNIQQNVLKRITELKAKSIYIIGGYGSISPSIESLLKDKQLNIIRISGQDRYETSVKVADYLATNYKISNEMTLASGENYPDALSIAPIAAKAKIPILLTPSTHLPDVIKTHLNNKKVDKMYIIGGEGVISKDIMNSLPNPERIAGINRYETNANVIKKFSNIINLDHPYIVSGNNFPDALVCTSLAAKESQPIILTDKIPDPATKNFILSNKGSIQQLNVLGGETIVPSYSLFPYLPIHIEIGNVPVIAQLPSLPTGCEAAATTMLLNWAGVHVSKEDVANALPKGPIPKYQGNQLRGANPNKVFVGNPYEQTGYGVYHKPIANLINNYLPGKAIDLTGCEFEQLLETVGSGKPIVVWATVNMQPTYVSKTWYDENGNEVNWKIHEHALTLIGYDNNNVIVNDPYIANKKSYPMSTFKDLWITMGRQAVTVR